MPTTFDTVYQRLNPAQREAVDTIEGPVMVVAGPGTGKTQVLAARIAAILQKTDVQPHNILALTFTESAAQNMRERVVQLIGRAGYYVQISTFHAFCQEVISRHPEFFPLERASSALTDLERYDMLQVIITQSKELELLKPINRSLFYIHDIIRAISQLKREGVDPEQLLTLIEEDVESLATDDTVKKAQRALAEKNIAKLRELLTVYREYEQRLRHQLRYDFDDMISLVARAFASEPLLLLEYQENIHYFLVDEYQDTNSAQNQVVELLASYWGDEANIFVVGDPHQAIYRFQGASIENVVGFAHRYPQAKTITLTYGYRSVQPIYDQAYHLIGHNALTTDGLVGAEGSQQKQLQKALSTKLRSQIEDDRSPQKTEQKPTGVEPEPAVVVHRAPSQTLELVSLAQRILLLKEQGVPLEEIAVLYRHNADVLELSSVLASHGIAFEIDGGSNVLESERIRQLLTLLRLVDSLRETGSDQLLFEVLCYDWIEIEQLAVLKLAHAAATQRVGLFALIDDHEVVSSVLTPSQWSLLQGFVNKLREWLVRDASSTFPAWFEQVLNESGYMNWLIAQLDKPQLLIHLNSLFSETKALALAHRGLKLREYLHALDTMIEHGISITAEDLNARGNAVRLSTAHRAKGQEWQYVFVLHCIDGKWGNNRSRELIPLPTSMLRNTDLSKKERNEDERRLFYVVITRAKRQVVLSYPQTVVSSNRSRAVTRSMFIDELFAVEPKVEDIFASSDDAQAALETLLLHSTPVGKPDAADGVRQHDEREQFFAQLVKNFKLSVTGLNTYLRDPREFVLTTLLKVPQAKPEHLAFGTAVHAALEKLYRHWMQRTELLSLTNLHKTYQESLERELLDSTDFDRRLRHGRALLETYHQQFDQTTQPLFIERSFGGSSSRSVLDLPGGGVPLAGRIDRVDWLDRERKLVRVIDYKTGKAKSVNEILGATVSSSLSEREQSLDEAIRGPYKRQLLFYKLLSQLDVGFQPKVTEGIFEFVEPDSKTGKTVSRVFALPDEEVQLLVKLIAEVMAEIRDLAFLSALD